MRRRLPAARSAARDAVNRPGGVALWPVLSIVLILGALPQIAEAQGQGRGQGRPKTPQASGETINGSAGGSTGISTSQFRQFGVWLDDATTAAEGGGSAGFGIGYWRGAGASLLDVPILDASYAVHDRFTLGASVPFYRSENAGATSRGIDDVYLMRVEQYYPFPARTLISELARFPNSDLVWAQEEPKNMGAWSFMEPNLEWVLQHLQLAAKRAIYAGRPASAATATGLLSRHTQEQKTLLQQALTG